MGLFLILPPALRRWGSPRRQGLCSHLAHKWANSDSAPPLYSGGDPRDGRGDVATLPTSGPILILGAPQAQCARSATIWACTNRPMQCVLCRDTIWLYGMAHHFDSKHAGSAPPSALCVKAEEKEMVVNWSGKKNNSKRSHHEMHAEDGGDVA